MSGCPTWQSERRSLKASRLQRIDGHQSQVWYFGTSHSNQYPTRQIRLNGGELGAAGQSRSLLGAISRTNQDMRREQACDGRGYQGIIQLTQGESINTTRKKGCGKGLAWPVTPGQRVSRKGGRKSWGQCDGNVGVTALNTVTQVVYQKPLSLIHLYILLTSSCVG